MIFADYSKTTSLLALIILILLAGCNSLPDYAQPRIYPSDIPLPNLVVTYRDLVVGDFHAKNIPETLNGQAHNLNAYSVVAIRTVPGAQYILSRMEYQGMQMYSGRVGYLAFEAVMVPAHSWWRPSLAKDKFAYVLQHEQIHFALMEVAARRLTKKAARERETLTVYDINNEAVKKRLKDRIDQWLDALEKDVVKEHTEFDRATSRRYEPKVQQQWYDRVERELEDLAEWN